MFYEGAWIIDNESGRLGTVTKIFTDGVSAKFGQAWTLRTYENITLAPIDIQQEDLLAMQHLAVETGDKQWFAEIANRMGVEQLG